MLNIMVDLETMGVGPRAAITSIGAVVFYPGVGLGEEFYATGLLESSVKYGLEMEPETVTWWLKQSVEAKKEHIGEQRRDLKQTLIAFNDWIRCLGFAKGQVSIWGNGAAFDNVILKSAYDATKLDAPWNFGGDKCFRTLKNLFPCVYEPDRTNVLSHHALDDARWQAEYAVKIFSFIDSKMAE